MVVGRIEETHCPTAALWIAEAHRDYFERLVAYGRVLTGDEAVAEDLAQEIFFSAFRTLQEKPNYQIDNPWGWLRGSMRNAVANWCRGTGRRKAREARVAKPDAVQAEEGTVDLERLYADSRHACAPVHISCMSAG